MRYPVHLGASVVVLWLVAACAAAPSPTPTVPPPAPATSAPSAGAAAAATTVAGTVDQLAGRVLTVTTSASAKQVRIADDARIEQEGRGTPADLRPGLSVGVTGKTDGTAVSIRVFPAALGTPRPGQFPMTGANQGNLMTNSVITAFDGKTLTVDAGGKSYQIAVPPDAEVLKPVPAALTDLQAGKRVLAAGTPGTDGSLVANSVSILGTPPQ